MEVDAVLPKPLQKLYDRAALFLDKDSTHQDHYWAVGIHKAIHAAFPEFGGSHTAPTKSNKAARITQGQRGSSARQDPPLVRTHRQICDTPDRCSVASIASRLRREDENRSAVVVPLPAGDSQSDQLHLFSQVGL